MSFLQNEPFPKHAWAWFSFTHSIKYMKNTLYLKKCREKPWRLCSLEIFARGAHRKLGALRSLCPSNSHPCMCYVLWHCLRLATASFYWLMQKSWVAVNLSTILVPCDSLSQIGFLLLQSFLQAEQFTLILINTISKEH